MKKKKAVQTLLRLDLGCGPHPREGFLGVDQYDFPGETGVKADLTKRWPWEDSTVTEAHASHVLEHFNAVDRCHFVNELYRVLIPGGTCQVITPHWGSCRAYGDPTHQWPPVGEFYYYYLSRAWRLQNAPHTDIKYLSTGFDCDFEVTWGYSLREDLRVRNQEFQQFAIANYKEVVQDCIANFKAIK